MKTIVNLALALVLTASAAQAATIVDFAGNSTGTLATGSISISLNPDGNSFTGTLTNTAPFDARITAFGFNLGPGNLNGYTGTPDPLQTPSNVDFDFRDTSLGNVPQFNGIDLDFGYITGTNFSGGSPNDGLDNLQSLGFTITGTFAGLTESQIASGLYVRFQRVGEEGGSDVASSGDGVTQVLATPEPASMLLLGSGLMYLARRRYKSANV